MPSPYENNKFRDVAKRLLEVKHTSLDLSASYRQQGGVDYVDVRIHRPSVRDIDSESFDDVMKELT